ncbi:MAG TPA: hypothetical protein EYO76_05465 [Flavobacteriaceae bacterium]|nr:hypothetical protein [Flavobacteriaceae bacterium]
MKIKKLNILISALFLIIFSCSPESKNELEYGFSFLVNKQWKRVQFNIPIELDFNLDGVASSNMVNEFDCLGNESFILSPNNKFEYNLDGLFLTTTALDPSNPNYTEQYSCDEDGLGGSFFGTFTMLNENTVRLKRDSVFDSTFGNEFTITLTFIDNKLIRTYTGSHPVSYD